MSEWEIKNNFVHMIIAGISDEKRFEKSICNHQG